MAKSRIISGIELGSSKISTIIASIQESEFESEPSINIVGVASVESRGIKKGQIVDIEEATEAAIASVEAAERMAGYNLDSAYISIGGAHITSQNSHGVVAVSDPQGEIDYEDVDRVIEAASAVSLPSSRDVVHILPREFIVDGEAGVRDPVGMSGIRLEGDTHLITASNSAIKNIRKAINEVGVNINGLVFSGLASSYAVLTKTEKELGCCLIDIGGGTTSICLYIDGAITYSGVIPIGAKNVTNDLAIGLRVSLDSAEKIKKYLSDSQNKSKKKDEEDELEPRILGVADTKKVSKKTLVEGIIRPRLNEIFTMVRIDLEKQGLLNKVPSGAIITGGGAETVGVSDSAKRMLSLPVRVGKPKGVGGLIDDIMNPQFSTVLGLVIYGSEKEPEQPSGGFAKKLRIPSSGFAQKIITTIKDLLP